MQADSADEAPNRRKLSSGWRRFGVAIIGALSVGLIVWLAPPAKVLDEIGRMNVSWVLVAVALELGSCLSYVIVFRYFFPELSRANSRRVAWIAMGAGAVLPGGTCLRLQLQVCCCVVMV